MYEFEVEILLISTQRLITVILNIPFVMKTICRLKAKKQRLEHVLNAENCRGNNL